METYLSKRALLMKLTQNAEELIKSGFEGTHNQAILKIYRESGHGPKFRTIEGWNKLGFMVRAGERGLPIWAKDADGLETRRILNIFSSAQVFEVNRPRKAQQENHTKPMQPAVSINL